MQQCVPGREQHYLALIKAGLARRRDDKQLKNFPIVGTTAVQIESDVRTALNKHKAFVALYVGGGGAKKKNFHKDNMIDRVLGKRPTASKSCSSPAIGKRQKQQSRMSLSMKDCCLVRARGSKSVTSSGEIQG